MGKENNSCFLDHTNISTSNKKYITNIWNILVSFINASKLRFWFEAFYAILHIYKVYSGSVLICTFDYL